jgi:hypothetical protein
VCRTISGARAGIEVSLPPGSSIEYREGYRRDG